jgi:hypothetical protein
MSNQILLTHSGGINNTDIKFDLGGNKSNFTLASNPLNNLFEDITPEENLSGFVDYKCFYIYNNNNNLILENPTITLENEGLGGSDIEIGTIQQNDIQRITINGTPDDD